MTLYDYTSLLIQQCEYVESVHSSILIFDPKIYTSTTPQVECASVGSTCQPACKHFDPAKACKYSDLALNHQTFVQAFWQYRSLALKRQMEWKLFYECFHPKSDSKKAEKFEAIFPQDVPILGNQDAMSNFEVTKNLDPNDPSHWSKERVAAATGGAELKRRMATTDWDWQWYKYCRNKGAEPNMALCKEKNKLDLLLFREMGDSYENTGSYSIKKTHRDYLVLYTAYKALKGLLQVTIVFTD